MNKTVNINLAGLSFHLDENAYGKLSRYLNAIRNSLKDSEGSEEIMQDIEARIAELFSEKIEFQSQVITLRELDDVIAVMGQPEDYEVDEEIFEDAPPFQKNASSRDKTSHRQLYRDIDDKYIGGVSSGLGHYIGVDAIWIRLLWVLLVLAGLGSPILIYLLLWILVPAAVTTSDKLKMTGEPINISNIERKFKEGFNNVADKVKNVDYDKYGNKIKTGTSKFFDSLGEVIVTLFKVFAKLIGVFIVIISLLTLIGLVIGFITLGSIDFWGNNELTEYMAMVDTTNVPLWLWALLGLFAIGIPFFALFVLGLKLLVSNLKPMGATVKIVLIVIWALSIIGLTGLGIKQATERSFDGNYIEEEILAFHSPDTLYLSIHGDNQFGNRLGRDSDSEIKYTQDNKRVIYSRNIQINIKSYNDTIGKILIDKSAQGNNYLDAKNRAQDIQFGYDYNNNHLKLNGFFITDPKNKYRDQQIEITIFVPDGTVISSDENTSSYFSFDSNFNELSSWDNKAHYFRISKRGAECLDCLENKVEPETPNSTEYNEVEKQTDSLIPVQKSWEDEVKEDFKNQ
ncbi:PspC domain-containing protein [Aequorivita sp. H23M31]|uniref:PspC domain-containing protein n=1 Tax=Aequorivita ciconiae TaxID=2494375 RepID=A0A410G6X1_9FLAO|nr:PspC domain-containing protein [Aequorivita sp. H23M31]QAA83034.1 PspC domain-containing protein [Aequorivita sp. H23M31]